MAEKEGFGNNEFESNKEYQELKDLYGSDKKASELPDKKPERPTVNNYSIGNKGDKIKRIIIFAILPLILITAIIILFSGTDEAQEIDEPQEQPPTPIIVDENGEEDYQEQIGDRTPPEILIAYPTQNSVFLDTETIRITAEIDNPENLQINKVEFYANTEKIGETTSAPWTMTWSGVPVGRYALTAKVTYIE